MVWSIIENDDGVAAPINPILVELIDQLPEKDIHNLRVGVALSQAKIHIADGIDSDQH